MKCAIYTRVSTDMQETSIINQQEYFKDYITRHNLEIHDIYSDEAFSGTETTKRLSFQRLLQDGKNKKYDVLLAKSYSRFGRNQRETLTALAELFEHGIRIIFVEDGLDSLKDKGQFGLFAWLAEQESRKISERMKMTYQLYQKQGKIHNVTPTYGYEFDRNIWNFVVNEEEAVVVRMVFDLYLQGNGIKKISEFLNEKGLKTKNNYNWCPSIILNMIQNEFYIGSLVQGKTRSIDVVIKKDEYIPRKDWIVHKNNHQAIISDEIFYRTQDEYKKRTKYVKQHKRHSTAYLFSNLVKCKMCGGTCGARLSNSKPRKLLYTCLEYESVGLRCGHKRNAVPEYILIDNVKSSLEMLAENNFKIIRDYYKTHNVNVRRERDKTDIVIIDSQIEEQTRLGNSLLSLFTEGIIGKEQFKLQNDSIAEKLSSLMKQREEALLEQNKIAVNIDEQGETIKSVQKLLETDIADWNNEMMKKVINRIDIDMGNDVVEIVYNYAISTR